MDGIRASVMDRFIDGIEGIAALFVGIVAADIFISVLLRYSSRSIPDSYDFGRHAARHPHLLGHRGDELSRHAHHRRSRLGHASARVRSAGIDMFATLVLLFVVTVQTYTLFDKVRQTRIDNVLTYDLNLPTWPFFARGLDRRRVGGAADRDPHVAPDLRIPSSCTIVRPHQDRRSDEHRRRRRCLGFVALFALMLLRVPVGMAMGLVGVSGYAYLVRLRPALKLIGQTSMRTVTDYTFGVIPMFLLMGAFVSDVRHQPRAVSRRQHLRRPPARRPRHRDHRRLRRVRRDLRLVGRDRRDLLRPSPIPRCGASAIRRAFATGVIAAGGTLGAMLPPSTVLAVYGIITQQDIGKLFVAGILPGLLAISMHMLTIAIIGIGEAGSSCRAAPSATGRSARARCATSGRRCCCSSS